MHVTEDRGPVKADAVIQALFDVPCDVRLRAGGGRGAGQQNKRDVAHVCLKHNAGHEEQNADQATRNAFNKCNAKCNYTPIRKDPPLPLQQPPCAPTPTPTSTGGLIDFLITPAVAFQSQLSTRFGSVFAFDL